MKISNADFLFPYHAYADGEQTAFNLECDKNLTIFVDFNALYSLRNKLNIQKISNFDVITEESTTFVYFID